MPADFKARVLAKGPGFHQWAMLKTLLSTSLPLQENYQVLTSVTQHLPRAGSSSRPGHNPKQFPPVNLLPLSPTACPVLAATHLWILRDPKREISFSTSLGNIQSQNFLYLPQILLLQGTACKSTERLWSRQIQSRSPCSCCTGTSLAPLPGWLPPLDTSTTTSRNLISNEPSCQSVTTV